MKNEIKKGDVMVAKWGYSMILSTWVKVVKVSPKTILVQEIVSRQLSQEECESKKLKPGYLQAYSVPTDNISLHNNEPQIPFRLYHPTKSDQWIGDEKKEIEIWHGHPENMSIRLAFVKWDGDPEFEDHCD
jgi:hypothetical protein